MKYCPNCKIQYTDDSLQFCFEDGSKLIDYFSSKNWQPSSDSLEETETVVRLNRLPVSWEQSQVTHVATLQPKPGKSSLPIILIALLISMFLISAIGVWFLVSLSSLSASGLSNTNSNNSSNLSNIYPKNVSPSSTPSPTPTRTPTVNTNIVSRTPNRNANSGELKSNTNQKRISLGGETLKACNYLLGSGLYGKWKQMGAEKSLLGCPTINETEAARSPQGTTGRMTQFSKGDGGYLIWHGSGRYSGTTFEVSGCMYKLFSSIGGTKSWLGFPIKDGYSIVTGARQDFEGGYILWDSKTYKCQAYRN